MSIQMNLVEQYIFVFVLLCVSHGTSNLFCQAGFEELHTSLLKGAQKSQIYKRAIYSGEKLTN